VTYVATLMGVLALVLPLVCRPIRVVTEGNDPEGPQEEQREG
jgi:hypothetical protein